jgi:hypothetical protein
MNKTTTLITTLFILFALSARSQNFPETDSILIIENAKYLNGDLNKLLYSKARFSREALINDIQGDVVISFTISKDGEMDSVEISESPDRALSVSSILSIDALDGKWSPCLLGNKPVDKKYSIVYRYRIYMNSSPPSFADDAVKFFRKEKLKKSLKKYNKAIKDNPYDYELYDSRAIVREMTGDAEGAKQDRMTSFNLKNEVLAIIDITAMSITRTRQVRTVTHRWNY